MVKLNERDQQIVNALAANNMKVSEAARALSMGRNTLVYSLDRIKRVTGLDPMSFHDLVELVGEESPEKIYRRSIDAALQHIVVARDNFAVCFASEPDANRDLSQFARVIDTLEHLRRRKRG